MGINLTEAERLTPIKWILRSTIYFLFMGPIYSWFTGSYTYKHLHDLDKALISIVAFSGCINFGSQFLFLKFKERKISEFMNNLEKLLAQGE